MFQSEDGTLWGCTAESNARVFKIYEQKKDFNFSDTGFGGEILAYCETQNGDQWYSSIGLGLLKIDTTSSDTMQFLNDPKNPGFLFRRSNTFDHDIYVQSFSNDKELFTNIRGIVEDDSGWLWLSKEGYSGRTDTNLIKFNPHSGKVKYYVHDPNDEKSHGGGTIFDVFKDGDGRIWVTTDRNGELNLYNEETDDFTRFSYLNEHEVEKGISTHVGAIMNLRKNGHILIAHTSHNAMNKSAYLDEFDPVTKTFVTETIMLPPIFDDLHQFITGVEEDVNQNIWVSTIYMLHKIDHATGEGRKFSC